MEQKLVSQSTAEEIYKKYICWLYRLIVEDNAKFDLIVGPADSGTFLAESARLFFEKIPQEQPLILTVPIQRYEAGLGIDTGEHFHNKAWDKEITEKISTLPKVENILFVDDEIGLAYTAQEVIRLILESATKDAIASRVIYTILAENHAFEWRYDIPPIAIKYIAFSNKIKGVNGAIFEIIPDDILKEFQKIDKDITKKKICSLFTSGLVKEASDGKIFLNDALLLIMESELPHFRKLKTEFIERIKSLISSAIQEYLDGNLKLRD